SIPSEDPYEEAAQQLFEQAPHSLEYVPRDHVPVFVLEFEHPEDLAEMNAISSSLYHSLHPSGTPLLLPIPLSTPSTSRRAGIPEADTPPRNRPLLATPRPGALEARVAVLETHARRLKWQRQAVDDFAVQHIMRTQTLEAGARGDTLEDTGSSS
nr:hypothetical protein [Tanacetum cinerariifolium]